MKPTVLVVDDEAAIRSMFRELLTLEGYSVAEASHGGPVLEQIRASSQPLVVLLGLVMPDVDGEEVLEAVAADPALATRHRHRIIMLTGATDRASTGRVAVLRRQLGVPLIAKPFTFDAILSATTDAAWSAP